MLLRFLTAVGAFLSWIVLFGTGLVALVLAFDAFGQIEPMWQVFAAAIALIVLHGVYRAWNEPPKLINAAQMIDLMERAGFPRKYKHWQCPPSSP
jgi:hypothetical protein